MAEGCRAQPHYGHISFYEYRHTPWHYGVERRRSQADLEEIGVEAEYVSEFGSPRKSQSRASYKICVRTIASAVKVFPYDSQR